MVRYPGLWTICGLHKPQFPIFGWNRKLQFAVKWMEVFNLPSTPRLPKGCKLWVHHCRRSHKVFLGSREGLWVWRPTEDIQSWPKCWDVLKSTSVPATKRWSKTMWNSRRGIASISYLRNPHFPPLLIIVHVTACSHPWHAREREAGRLTRPAEWHFPCSWGVIIGW